MSGRLQFSSKPLSLWQGPARSPESLESVSVDWETMSGLAKRKTYLLPIREKLTMQHLPDGSKRIWLSRWFAQKNGLTIISDNQRPPEYDI